MGEVQKQSTNTFLVSIFGLGLGYVNKSILFPWILLADQIGLIGLIISCSSLFAELSNLGTTHSIVRFFPYIPEVKKRAFFLYNLGVVTIGFVVMLSLMVFFKQEIDAYYSKNSRLFVDYSYWVYILGFSNLFFLFFENYLKAILKITLPVLIQELYLRIAVTITLTFYFIGWINFDQFLIFHLSVYCLPFIYLLIYSLQQQAIVGTQTRLKLPGSLRRSMQKYRYFTYFNSVGSNIVFSIDTIMLSSIVGLKATGIYTTVLFISSALLIPYRSIYRVSSSLVPKLWKQKDMGQMQHLYQKVTLWNLILITYLVLLVGFGIDTFFLLLPKEFSEGKLLFFVLMFGRAVDAICGINGYILVTSKKYHVDVFFTFSLILSAIILNQIFIPQFGAIGAALVTSMIIATYNLTRVGYVYWRFKLQPFAKENLVVLAIGLVCVVVGFGIRISVSNSWIQTILISISITAIFWSSIYYFKIDEQMNRFINKQIDRLRK
jgi:O-antigen/teichoic acid export membrane protein